MCPGVTGVLKQLDREQAAIDANSSRPITPRRPTAKREAVTMAQEAATAAAAAHAMYMSKPSHPSSATPRTCGVQAASPLQPSNLERNIIPVTSPPFRKPQQVRPDLRQTFLVLPIPPVFLLLLLMMAHKAVRQWLQARLKRRKQLIIKFLSMLSHRQTPRRRQLRPQRTRRIHLELLHPLLRGQMHLPTFPVRRLSRTLINLVY